MVSFFYLVLIFTCSPLEALIYMLYTKYTDIYIYVYIGDCQRGPKLQYTAA